MSSHPHAQTENTIIQTNLHLQAANNIPIMTFGSRSLTLDLGLRRNFRWVFTIADVRHPILGADFLRSYNLLVDMRRRRLTDSLTQLNWCMAPHFACLENSSTQNPPLCLQTQQIMSPGSSSSCPNLRPHQYGSNCHEKPMSVMNSLQPCMCTSDTME